MSRIFLKKLTSLGQKKQTLFGLYDSANQPTGTRLNDFLIDHSRVSLQERHIFQLLAVMVDAGIRLSVLKMLAGRAGSERFRVINTTALRSPREDSFRLHGAIFRCFQRGGNRYCAAGEAAGNLIKC